MMMMPIQRLVVAILQIKDEAVCLRTLGATIVLLILEIQPKHAPLEHLIERGSNRGFIDATIIIKNDAAGWYEKTAPYDIHSDVCEGKWYSEADNVVAVLDIDDDHEGNVGGVLSMMKMMEGISIRHDLME